MNLLIGFLPHLWINRLSHQVGELSHSTHLFSKNRLGNWQLENVVWYILILCSFSDAAAGSLRVWLFIYQDQGWTSPDLVCLGATLLLTSHYITFPGTTLLHYCRGTTLHYLHHYITCLPKHYITYSCLAVIAQNYSQLGSGKTTNKYEAFWYLKQI